MVVFAESTMSKAVCWATAPAELTNNWPGWLSVAAGAMQVPGGAGVAKEVRYVCTAPGAIAGAMIRIPVGWATGTVDHPTVFPTIDPAANPFEALSGLILKLAG